MNAHERATAHGHPRQVCETCAGSGVVVWRLSWTGDTHDAKGEDCHGSGIVTGECMCGETAPLVPDLVSEDDCNGAILVCEKCAVSCYRCNKEATVSIRTTMKTGFTVEQFCDEHWEELNSPRLVAAAW